MGHMSVERIVNEIRDLPPRERLRLIRAVVDTLVVPARPDKSHPLVFGEFHGSKVSTEDDFKIAEWRPRSYNFRSKVTRHVEP
jgi:hypothetical protein